MEGGGGVGEGVRDGVEISRVWDVRPKESTVFPAFGSETETSARSVCHAVGFRVVVLSTCCPIPDYGPVDPHFEDHLGQ